MKWNNTKLKYMSDTFVMLFERLDWMYLNLELCSVIAIRNYMIGYGYDNIRVSKKKKTFPLHLICSTENQSQTEQWTKR